jgi:hypothetical protein
VNPQLDPKLHRPGPKYKIQPPTHIYNLRISAASLNRIPHPRQEWIRRVIEERLMVESPPTQAEIDAHDHPNR